MYATLAEGRNEQELLSLDRALAPDEESAEALLGRANMEAMKSLQATIQTVQSPRGH